MLSQTSACRAPRRWIIPSARDPRWVFAALLSMYALAGCTVLGFNRDPLQIGLTVGACAVLDMLFTWLFKREKLVPLSGFITGLGLSLLVNYPHDYLLLFMPAFFAIASKHVLTCDGRHVFNPGLIGVIAAIILGGGRFATSPPYQWGDHSLVAGMFIMLAAVAGFVTKIRRTPLVLSFLLSFAALTCLRAWLMRWHLPPQTLIEGTLASPAFFLFTFYMITDPKTSPSSTGGQIALGVSLAVLDLVFHFKSSLATLFMALFCASAVRWIVMLGRRWWSNGLASVIPSASWVKRCAALAIFGSGGAWLYVQVLHPAVLAPRPGFVFEKQNGCGITSELGDTLKQIDPRIAHIAKWVLSVGDAVAVGDFDGDGWQDLFLTHPLKRRQDRNALYRNVGGLSFQRVPLPALDEISAHPELHGLIAGALFADYDNSGRQSLLLTTGWGKVRILKNEAGGFRDVTAESGIDEYTVSVAATMADFDLDGDLDWFIGNAMQTTLPGYDKPTPFNIFALPPPEFEGDRRMFHFMHSTWHNAQNGGLNILCRNDGNGRFTRTTPMPETHWTMAVGTADLNHDGWPDLYCASDYGPDDLYLNEAGKGFNRVTGTFVGSIGRDTYKGMNVSIGDLDNRGWQDIHVSNVHAPLQAEGSLVWSTSDGVRFVDRASQRRLINEQRFGWGAAMGDLNLDGWLDLVQANGMVDDTADKLFDAPRDYWYRASLVMRAGPDVHSFADRWADLRGYDIWGHQQNRVCLSSGRAPAQFIDIANEAGITEKTNTRAAALADFDSDGDLDLVFTHQFATAEVFRNTRMETTPSRWIGLNLRGDGRAVNRDAVGAQVFVTAGKLRQMREVSLTSGFSAQSDRRLHYGLGDHAQPVDVEIHWPGGGVQRLRDVPVDQYHRIDFKPAAAAAVAQQH